MDKIPRPVTNFDFKIILLKMVVLLIMVFACGAVYAKKEAPPLLKTSDVIPGIKLSGPDYTIGQTVQNDGTINTFKITIDDKTYTVRGNMLMRERLNELQALQQLQAVKGTDVYLDAFQKAAMGPLNTAKNLITSPIGTLQGIGGGITSFFTNIGHAAFGGPSDQESGVMKTALGYDKVKRQFAYRVHVDPYTSFTPLADELGDIAWAAVAGGMTLSVAFTAIPGTGGTVVSNMKTSDSMYRLINDNSPAELKKRNAAKLKAMQINESIIDIFLEHPKLSPTQKTFIVEAISKINIPGREIFIERAIISVDDQETFQIQYWAALNAAYHKKIKPVSRFVRMGGKKSPVMQRKDGVLVAVLPVDYVAWTDEVANGMSIIELSLQQVEGITGKEMWLGGYASPETKKALTDLGWKVVENADKLLDLL